MRVVGGRGAAGAVCVVRRAFGAMSLLLALAGCTSSGWQLSGPAADLRGTTVAVESIEGPPPPVVHRFAQDLNEAAANRQIAIVPRGTQAVYRVRGYLAPQAGGASIAWAWDIYDAAENRAFRLRGEEKAAPGRRSWSDEQAMRRIARASVEQLAAFISEPRPAPPAAPPPARGPSIIAAGDDFRPEAAGIFQVFTASPAPSALDSPAEAVPLPPHRPGRSAVALAFGDPQ
jgi:hypothetical protein